MKETFVPLDKADVRNRDLRLAVTKQQVKDAPQIDGASEHLDEDGQQRLERYYAVLTSSMGRGGDAGNGRDAAAEATAGRKTDARHGLSDDRRDARSADRADRRDGAMTRSEELLKVGTERTESGTVRLRKYVVTENQQVTVPVSHEEVRIEREPVTNGRSGNARIGDDERSVTLHAERPVVETEVHEVERVRLGTETVTEDRTVSGEVRKERIDVEDPQHRMTGREKDRREQDRGRG